MKYTSTKHLFKHLNSGRLSKLMGTILIMSLSLSAASFAQEELVEPVLKFSFDDESSAPLLDGTPEIVPGGMKGNALKIGDPGSIVTWKIGPEFNWGRGAISFWFMPEDWKANNRVRHLLWNNGQNLVVCMTGSASPSEPAFLCFQLRDQDGKPLHLWNSFTNFENGKWYFVTITWDEEKGSLYLNGQVDVPGGGSRQMAMGGGVYMTQEPFVDGVLNIGTDANWKHYDTIETTLIDEIEFRTEVLDDDEVRQLYFEQKPRRERDKN